MTLLETIRIMENVARVQPSVRMIVRNDIFRMNGAPDRRYGVFAWTQQQHSGTIGNDLMSYAFSLFYVDRLTHDRRNELEVQSVGIQTLDNIIRRLNDLGIEAESWTFQTFNQRFTDECAGVWCNVTFQVPVSLVCAEEFGDYLVSDFNDDFLIY